MIKLKFLKRLKNSNKLVFYIFIFSCLSSYSQNIKDSLILKGDSLSKNENYKESIAFYKQYLEIDSSDYEVYFKIGNLYGTLGVYNDAIIYLSKSININPYNAKVYCVRGLVYGIIDSVDKCFDNLNNAILLDDKFHLAYFYKGQFTLVNKDFDSALKYFEKAISIEEKGEYFLYRGYSKMGLGFIDSACEDIYTAYQMNNIEAKTAFIELCDDTPRTLPNKN